jgi:hypothetical protein
MHMEVVLTMTCDSDTGWRNEPQRPKDLKSACPFEVFESLWFVLLLLPISSLLQLLSESQNHECPGGPEVYSDPCMSRLAQVKDAGRLAAGVLSNTRTLS